MSFNETASALEGMTGHVRFEQEAARMSTEPTGRPGATSRADRPGGPLDVAVIGGGQAGLAIGHLLARRGLRFLILEAGDAVGSAWRDRWDSLVLFTPARFSGLPGLPFPGDPDH
jgi:putative flavoprotein involved in K+ transport